jgi:hypothetical protein
VAEGARLESVFRLTPNEGSNPSLSARLNEKAPNESSGLFHLNRRARIWFGPLVRQICRERIWTRFSAARRASTMDGAGNPSARKSVGLFHLNLRSRIWFEPYVRSVCREQTGTRFSAAPKGETGNSIANSLAMPG